MGATFPRMRDFYAECWRRSWRGKLLHVEAVSGMLALFAVPIVAIWNPGDSYMNWVPFAVFAAVFIGTVFVGFVTAPYWIMQEIRVEKDSLQSQIDTYRTKKIELIYREADNRHLFTDEDRTIACIKVQNCSGETIDDIDIYCEGGIPRVEGEDVLGIEAGNRSVPLHLSPGEYIYKIIIAMHCSPYQTNYRVLVPYRSSQDGILRGSEFSIKIVAVGRQVHTPTRIWLNCGQRNGSFYAEVMES